MIRRQGNDVGTACRSGLYPLSDAPPSQAKASRDMFQSALSKAGRGKITAGIAADQTFNFAETAHQQYLAGNRGGCCNPRGTGVSCPMPQRASAQRINLSARSKIPREICFCPCKT
jgi:peptide-methionine (S)-S-oxide reductase